MRLTSQATQQFTTNVTENSITSFPRKKRVRNNTPKLGSHRKLTGGKKIQSNPQTKTEHHQIKK